MLRPLPSGERADERGVSRATSGEGQSESVASHTAPLPNPLPDGERELWKSLTA